MEFDAEARDHQRGQRFCVMSRLAQFVALELGQLASRQSLRDIVINLRLSLTRQALSPRRGDGQPLVARAGQCLSEPFTLYEALFGSLLSTLSATVAVPRFPRQAQAVCG